MSAHLLGLLNILLLNSLAIRQLKHVEDILHRRPPCLFLLRVVTVFQGIPIALGAPGDLPPCIRHLPFFIAPLRHGFPDRLEWAPHLGLWCMGNCLCIGLFL